MKDRSDHTDQKEACDLVIGAMPKLLILTISGSNSAPSSIKSFGISWFLPPLLSLFILSLIPYHIYLFTFVILGLFCVESN